MNKEMKAMRFMLAAVALVMASTASAQLPWTRQNPNGPTFANRNQAVVYPYPGQCLANPADARFPGLVACDPANSSFECVQPGMAPQTAGGWLTCGTLVPFPVGGIAPIVASAASGQTPGSAVKYKYEVVNPPAYSPDVTTYPGADYYEIGLHESWGFQFLVDAIPNLFPNPKGVNATVAVPNGMQWTGLTCNLPNGCACPVGFKPITGNAYCATGRVAQGQPLFTPIWGVGQINMNGTLGVDLSVASPADAVASPWSANKYVATWPSISIWATKGRPVVVKWVNEFPNNHVLCPHPDAADWPCSIDRTFMGVKPRIDPSSAYAGINTTDPSFSERVNKFGSPQQPDNSWVTHLHGGDIPPGVDGFAQKWFGNVTTASIYNAAELTDRTRPLERFITPPFEGAPVGQLHHLQRPVGNSDIYAYPMDQEEATIWFHDHTLGKTHHNVIAGPAGFVPVYDPVKHRPAGPNTPAGPYNWLNPVTAQSGTAGAASADLFLAIQDRSFNEDGTINFSTGLGNPIPAPVPPAVAIAGQTPITNGVNPQIHPTWVPEYFGDHAVVNGVLWPRKSVGRGWVRIRLVDGSDSRCYTLGLSTQVPRPGAVPNMNVAFYVIANDQGYLRQPVRVNSFSMCPGERYELLVDFSQFRVGQPITMVNTANAPFPVGLPPTGVGSPYPHMNQIMQFVVDGALPAQRITLPTTNSAFTRDFVDLRSKVYRNRNGAPDLNRPNFCTTGTNGFYTDLAQVAGLAAGAGCIKAERQMYLNERIDPTTLLPLGMQLDGVPYEFKVTETPRKGTIELWRLINLTVDAHPMHPHLVKHQIVSRQALNVGAYQTALCGAIGCEPAPAPGPEKMLVPNVALVGALGAPVAPAAVEAGWKDATQVPPAMVTNIVAWWGPGYTAAASVDVATAPPHCTGGPGGTCLDASTWTYEDVTTGPYVWHCHINSHEDSEMMRTSLVVP